MKTMIIGAGGIAQKHCKALQTLGVTIAGVFDIDQSRAEILAKEYHTVSISDPIRTMDQVDMIHILTPPSKRVEYVEAASARGIPVFMEKPAAMTLENALKMEELIKQSGGICMIGFTQRFRKGYARLKEYVDQGRIGDIIQVYSFRIGPGPGFDGRLEDSWRTNKEYVCGMTIESLSHDIDFLMALAGDVVKVEGITKGTVAALPQFDNNVIAVMQLSSGAIGNICASWSSHISFNVKGVIGTRGSVLMQGNDIWDTTQIIADFGDGGKISENINDIFQSGDGYLEENRYFLKAIKDGEIQQCSMASGRRVLEISLELLKSNDKFREKC